MDGILIDPMATNDRARRFYERLGFRFVENRRFGDDDCAVYRLARGDWESQPPGGSVPRGIRRTRLTSGGPFLVVEVAHGHRRSLRCASEVIGLDDVVPRPACASSSLHYGAVQ